MKIAIIGFYILLAGNFCLSAQVKNSTSDWESKPVDRWEKEDIDYLLNKSPWGQKIERPMGTSLSPVLRGAVIIEHAVVFTLQSAMTIRLANIRRLQLAQKYDSMDMKSRAAFDSKYQSSLECPLCDKYYIVAIKGDSRILQNAPTVQRRSSSIYLSNEKGEKRTLSKYSPQTGTGSEALFFFPRNNEKGEPLIKPVHETLTFNFKYESDDDDLVRLFERIQIRVREITRENIVIF